MLGMKSRLMPLGIDVGAARVRVAVAERYARGVRIKAVVGRDLARNVDEDIVAIIIEDIISELEVGRMPCVAAVGLPDATLRSVVFPSMSYFERLRAARFDVLAEASRPGRGNGIVRVYPTGDQTGTFAVSSIDEVTFKRHLGLLRKAGLRVIAVDHDGCAIARALREYDAILDVGYEKTRLHAVQSAVPRSWLAPVGGQRVTEAIATDLDIDVEAAERRKRILGTAGAGTTGFAAFADTLSALLRAARSQVSFSRLALIGNGAKLPGLMRELADRTGIECEIPIAPLLRDMAVSSDTMRATAPDWTLAASLATWCVA